MPPGSRQPPGGYKIETVQEDQPSRYDERVGPRTSSNSNTGIPSRANSSGGGWCCLRRRGSSDSSFKQTFVILRHSERKDYVDKTYKTSEEGKKWPFDAPLTEAGIKLAKDVADELAAVHTKANFVTIACSPYRRCMETAAEVAKKLNLPVVIDQEIGEVRDRVMPQDKVAHRSPQQLNQMAKELGFKLINPILEDGGVKLFGKTPNWPESLDDAKNRYVVRMETYIRKSAEERQNMILVTHADAVVAGLAMFERGGADVHSMGFCARVIASRGVKENTKGDVEHGVFAEQWVVEAKDVGAEIVKSDGAMGKYYEKLYIEKCDETQEMVAKRKEKRTKTDAMFDKAIRDVAAALDDEEDEERPKPKPKAKGPLGLDAR